MLSFRRWVTAWFLKALLTACSIPGSPHSHLEVHWVLLSNSCSMNPPPTFAVGGVYMCSQHAHVPQQVYPKNSAWPLFPPALLDCPCPPFRAELALPGGCRCSSAKAGPQTRVLPTSNMGNAPSDCWGAGVLKVLLSYLSACPAG